MGLTRAFAALSLLTTALTMPVSLLLLTAGAQPITAQTVFSIRGDGTILKSGKPWFPMGFYIDRSDVASYTAQVNAITAAGAFNVINLPYGSGDWNAFLDLCAGKGIHVVSQLDYAGDFTAAVRTYKNHPAMYAWSVADDADNGYFTTAQLRDRNSQIKSADVNHPTETSLTGYYASRRSSADTYTAIADVSCYQCYPITPPSDYDVTSANALTQTYLRTLLYVQSAAKVNRPMIMNTQYFSWGSQSPNSRYPTAAEVRNMTYSGLAAGIKGIIAYTFSTSLTNQTAEWNEIKALRTDISALEGALLDGSLTRVVTGDQEVVVSLWDYEDTSIVVAINTSYSATKTLNLTLPGTHAGPAQALFARLATGLTFANSKLTGQIMPQEVHVYRLSMREPTEVRPGGDARGAATGKSAVGVRYFDSAGRRVAPAPGTACPLRLHHQPVADR